MRNYFSIRSANYEKNRPDYPPELYEYIFDHVKNFDHAWDCATGNGQAAKQLARVFDQVEASDISSRQLENAYKASNISYHIQAAESSSFKDNQFDLITVAQALHWFDFDKFFKEAKRVLKPSGILAVWTYGLLTVTHEIDELIRHFHNYTIGSYWSKERIHVDRQYEDIKFPFDKVLKNTFMMNKSWSLSNLTGYLRTWSGVKHYKKIKGGDPVDTLEISLSKAWKKNIYDIKIPLTVYIAGDHS